MVEGRWVRGQETGPVVSDWVLMLCAGQVRYTTQRGGK